MRPRGWTGAVAVLLIVFPLLVGVAVEGADPMAAAREALARQDFGAALAALQNAGAAGVKSAEGQYLLGLALKGTGRSQEAITAFQEALKRQPKYPEASLEVGLLYLADGRYREAETILQKALERNPARRGPFCHALGLVKAATDSLTPATVWLIRAVTAEPDEPAYHKTLADVYARQEVSELALAEYGRTLELGIAAPAQIHYAMGRLHARARQWPAAVASWERALTADTSYAPACADLASFYLASTPPRYDEAVLALRRLARLRPDDSSVAADLAGATALSPSYRQEALPLLEVQAQRLPEDARLHALIGRLSLEQGNYTRAVVAFGQAVRLEPGLEGARQGLAEAQKASGDTAATIATLLELAGSDTSGRDDVAGALGVLLYQQKRYEEAVPYLKQKIASSPSVPVLYRLLAQCYLQKQEYAAILSEVKPALDQAVAAYPDVRTLSAEYSTLGSELYRAGQYDAAVVFFQERLKGDPENGSAYLNIGFARYAQKQYDSALVALRQATRLQPDNAQAHFLQGVCYRFAGKHPQALASFLKALELEPDNVEALQQVGLSCLLVSQSLQRAGKHEESQAQAGRAVRYLERALERRDDVQTHLWLAQGLALSRQIEKAREEFDRVLRLDPNNQEARSGLDRLKGG
ncbi:MAG: tetratricopeptide repeat protein [Candidatus Latescibacterota bacterium]